MAQKNTSQVIAMAAFMLLTLVFAIISYFLWDSNRTLQAQVKDSAGKLQNAKTETTDKDLDLGELKTQIGMPGADVGRGANEAGSIVMEVGKVMAEAGGDGTAAASNLVGTVRTVKRESDNNAFVAENRNQQMNTQQSQYIKNLEAKDQEIQSYKAAKSQLEERLLAQESKHSEELEALEGQIATLRTEKAQLETEKADIEVTLSRQIEALTDDVNAKRIAIESLRRQLREKEELRFSKPDGLITSVDPNRGPAGLAFVNLGSADGMRTGVKFSVYTQDNSGVGRNDNSEIKGKIEITKVLGPRQSAGVIIEQDQSNPIAADDPVYSPIFQAGQSLEVVVVGRVSQDGLDRDAFRRMVTAHGAKIVSQVDDLGDFADGSGNLIDVEDAKQRITSNTRFIIIADQGDINTGSSDKELAAMLKKIRDNSNVLRERALNLGIHEVGLSTFLEHVGFAPRQTSWTPSSGRSYPGKLTNGAKSQFVNDRLGDRQSVGNVSALYTGETRQTESYGQVSEAYQDR